MFRLCWMWDILDELNKTISFSKRAVLREVICTKRIVDTVNI